MRGCEHVVINAPLITTKERERERTTLPTIVKPTRQHSTPIDRHNKQEVSTRKDAWVRLDANLKKLEPGVMRIVILVDIK
jgi:uncharacterized protein YbcC (UPF0753/DUF2309 family)